MIRLLFVFSICCSCFIFSSFSYREKKEEQQPVRVCFDPPAPCIPEGWNPPLFVELPLEDEFNHKGFKGRWVEVCATAYTPTNPIDADYHATKGKYRWKTADGRTDVRRVPYGIAVPLQLRKDDKKIPVWAFGTRVIIPAGNGYLDRSRPDDRIFKIDDTSESSKFFYSKEGKMHVDVRFIDYKDAIKWAGPQGYRFIKIFVIEE